MHRTDAAAVDALHAGGDLVMNFAGFEHGSRLVFPVLWRQSAFDSLLAIPENLGVVSFHSKWPFVGCDCCCDKLNSTSIYGHFVLLFWVLLELPGEFSLAGVMGSESRQRSF